MFHHIHTNLFQLNVNKEKNAISSYQTMNSPKNECTKCRANDYYSFPSFHSLFLSLSHSIRFCPFSFALMMVLIFFQAFIMPHLSWQCSKCARSRSLAFLLLLFYYIIMFCASFSRHPAFSNFSFSPIHPGFMRFNILICPRFSLRFFYLVRVLMLLAHLVAHCHRHPSLTFPFFFFYAAVVVVVILVPLHLNEIHRWWQSTEGLFTSCYIRGFV